MLSYLSENFKLFYFVFGLIYTFLIYFSYIFKKEVLFSQKKVEFSKNLFIKLQEVI